MPRLTLGTLSLPTSLLALSTLRLETDGGRAFVTRGPQLWNSLQLSIRQATSVSSFKNLVKSFYFIFIFLLLRFVLIGSLLYIFIYFNALNLFRCATAPCIFVFKTAKHQHTHSRSIQRFQVELHREPEVGFKELFFCLFVFVSFFLNVNRFVRSTGMREKSGCWDWTDLKYVTISSKGSRAWRDFCRSMNGIFWNC